MKTSEFQILSNKDLFEFSNRDSNNFSQSYNRGSPLAQDINCTYVRRLGDVLDIQGLTTTSLILLYIYVYVYYIYLFCFILLYMILFSANVLLSSCFIMVQNDVVFGRRKNKSLGILATHLIDL